MPERTRRPVDPSRPRDEHGRYIRTCIVDGCELRASGRMCATHYQRLRKYGSTDPRPPAHAPWIQPNGYQMFVRPGHVLARHDGRVYVHRFVLFEAIGYGPHPCCWCRIPLTWGLDLFADHVDHDRSNNASSNIVASCRTCNNKRAGARRRAMAIP